MRQMQDEANVHVSPIVTTRGPSGHVGQPGKVKNPRFNEKGELLYFNCSANDHYPGACPKPQRNPGCDICNRSGHVRKDSRQSASGEKTGITPTQSCVTAAEVKSRSAKYFMTAQFNDEDVKAFLDLSSQWVTPRKMHAEYMADRKSVV